MNDALGWLDCRVEASLDTGDRTIYLAEVMDGRYRATVPPLTIRRLLRIAPPDKLQALKALLARDSGVDGPAVRAWRERRRQTSS